MATDLSPSPGSPIAAVPNGTGSLELGKLGISNEPGHVEERLAEVVSQEEAAPGDERKQDDGWGVDKGWSSWDDGGKAVTDTAQYFWENGPTKSKAAWQDSWESGGSKAVETWQDGWEEKGKQEASENAADLCDFTPCSPSAYLQDESYGADYVDEGFLERELEIFGQKMSVTIAYTAMAVENWLEQCPPEDNMFGFDLEWQPNRQRGDDNKVALLQLSVASRCLLIQLLYIDRIPVALEVLLANADVKLGGVGVRQDIKKLEEDYGLKCRGEVELAVLAAEASGKKGGASLAALSQSILGLPYKKTRSLTCSNWAVQDLSFRQIQYAASDAWLSYALLVTLTSNKLKGDQSPLGTELADAYSSDTSGVDYRARDVSQVAAFLRERERARLLLLQDQNSSPAEQNAPTSTVTTVLAASLV